MKAGGPALDILDCAIVGAGPAGLAAAIYLSRFRRKIAIFDNGQSRASLIPLSRNCPGFPIGVNGEALLCQLREQAKCFGVSVIRAFVQGITKPKTGFELNFEDRTVSAATVILATGAVDIEPPIPDSIAATKQGYLRHCPICDAYEVIDRKIAVLGHGKNVLREAAFLSTYSNDITIATLGKSLEPEAEAELSNWKRDITLVTRPVRGFRVEFDRFCGLEMEDRDVLYYDAVYAALGCQNRSGLGKALGAASDEEGALQVDSHCQTSVPGLYAIGDLCSALNQISVGLGHGAIAATAVHNSLAG